MDDYYSPAPAPAPPPIEFLGVRVPRVFLLLFGVLAYVILLLLIDKFISKHHSDNETTSWGSSTSSPPRVVIPDFPQGLDRSTLAVVGNDMHDTECAICLNHLEDREECRLLTGCGHAYHKDCIDEWLGKKGNCPMCRTDVCNMV